MLPKRLYLTSLAPALLVLTLPMGLAEPAAAQVATLVEDLNQQPSDVAASSSPHAFFDLGNGKAVFFAGPQARDEQVWVTDGTSAGTELLSTQPLAGTNPETLTRVQSGRWLYWLTETPLPECDSEFRLLRTDGSRAGTVTLTDCGEYAGTPYPLGGGRAAFFTSSERSSGVRKLWAIDGSSSEKQLLADFGFEDVSLGFVLSGKLHFFANPFGDAGLDLWQSDGTPAGTGKLLTIAEGTFFDAAVVSGNDLYFLLSQNSDQATLWRTDGTAGGTRQVPTPAVGGFLRNSFRLVAGEGKVYFVGTDIQSGRELWVSDGTSAGTRQLTSFPGDIPLDFNLTRLEVHPAGAKVFFITSTFERGREVWVTEGNPNQIRRLSPDCTTFCNGVEQETPPVVVGHRLLWIQRGNPSADSVWVSDGTVAGTAPLSGLCAPAGCEALSNLFLRDGVAFVVARHPDLGHELWTLDGTPTGTRRITDFQAPPDFFPFPSFHPAQLPGTFLGSLNELLLLGAGEPIHGFEVWRSDGTPAGTRLVADLEPSAEGAWPSLLAATGGRLTFEACVEGRTELRVAAGGESPTLAFSPFFNECQGSFFEHVFPTSGPTFYASRLNGLWRSDGTPEGTYRVPAPGSEQPEFSSDTQYFAVGNRLFFVAGFERNQFWVSDGTPDGTHLILDLESASSPLRWVAPAFDFGGELFFIGTDPEGQVQLWRTDTAPNGAIALLPAYEEALSISESVEHGGWLYFFSTGQETPTSLWRTDGTPDNFEELHAVGSPLSVRPPYSLGIFRDQLFYFAGIPGGRWGLWKSDGTPAGVEVVYNFANRLALSGVRWVAAGDKLFFVGESPAHGLEVWVSDGTFEGTRMTRDIAPGLASPNLFEIVSAGSRVFFPADDGVHGRELWVTDGTEAGTRLVHDLAPGPASSDPRSLTVVGDKLYFAADNRVSGQELWAIDFAANPTTCPPSDSGLCLQNNRFRVEIDWRDFQGNTGRGTPVPITADTGYFWFFNPANVETIVKVLDGRPINEHFWTFYGALSNVEYTMTVTDAQTGLTQRYFNPTRQFASVGDTESFGPNGASLASFTAPNELLFQSHEPLIEALFDFAKAGSCAPSSTRLCLSNGRFAVEASWTDFQGNSGVGMAEGLTSDTGYFWFFRDSNVEVVTKVLDGRPLNGKFWVFFGALSNVEYTLTVTDTETGAIKTYFNPSRQFGSAGDTAAF